MKVALLGCGAQGKAIAYDLAANNHSVLAIDQNEKACRSLKNLPKRVANNILAKTCDVEDKQKLGSLIQNVDIIVSALPGRYGKYIWKLAIETKKNLVDISYAPDDPFGLDKEAQRRNIKIVVDAGFAPGLSNILIGNAYTKLAPIEKITIYVGGLPQKPKLPLKYTLTWSIEDLIEEYTRPARIIRDYKIVTVPALSGIELLKIPRLGEVECFYTDGLRTLLKTIKNVKNMEEKTIRYPGHAELMKELLNYGNPPQLNPRRLKPKEFIVNFLKEILRSNDNRDLTVLIIKIKSSKKNQTGFCLDYYDQKHAITSMARMTGYTASIIAQLLSGYPYTGIITPEHLGMNLNFYNLFLKELKNRKIKINISEH